METDKSIVNLEKIEKSILIIREQRVMLDNDLAELYGVETRILNQAVRRNMGRFPADFMFQLSTDEAKFIRSQFVTLKKGRGRHRKYLPYAFTEQGVAMLSSVLNSKRAIKVNIAIMRAFVKLRETISAHKELAIKFNELENKIERHDRRIKAIFDAIKHLMASPKKKRNPIGFR